MNLLALASAEAGGGDDGTVSPGEAIRILSRLARGSDPNVRIKALDSRRRRRNFTFSQQSAAEARRLIRYGPLRALRQPDETALHLRHY